MLAKGAARLQLTSEPARINICFVVKGFSLLSEHGDITLVPIAVKGGARQQLPVGGQGMAVFGGSVGAFFPVRVGWISKDSVKAARWYLFFPVSITSGQAEAFIADPTKQAACMIGINVPGITVTAARRVVKFRKIQITIAAAAIQGARKKYLCTALAFNAIAEAGAVGAQAAGGKGGLRTFYVAASAGYHVDDAKNSIAAIQ